jgi:2-hydroxy-3-keto-5-methylthiopentenyl-1-phosphate phosphatase
MLILCDFDGTLSLDDVTNTLLDHFTGSDWRESVREGYRAKHYNHLAIMQGAYTYLKTPLPEVLDFCRTLRLRPNFDQLIGFCQHHNHFLAVVSGGLDLYIREFLPPGIPFYSYRGSCDEAGQDWRVDLPDWPDVNLAQGDDFKVRVLEELRRAHSADVPVVFIGDGRNDGPVSQHADQVFAVRGSYLARNLTGRGRPCTEFVDFAEIVAALEDFSVTIQPT